MKVLRGGSDTIDSLVSQIKDQKKDYITSYSDLSLEKLKEFKESAVDATASLSDRLSELGVKAVVRKANVDAGYSEADADRLAKSLTKPERQNFEAVKLDELKKSTKKNKDDGRLLIKVTQETNRQLNIPKKVVTLIQLLRCLTMNSNITPD